MKNCRPQHHTTDQADDVLHAVVRNLQSLRKAPPGQRSNKTANAIKNKHNDRLERAKKHEGQPRKERCRNGVQTTAGRAKSGQPTLQVGHPIFDRRSAVPHCLPVVTFPQGCDWRTVPPPTNRPPDTSNPPENREPVARSAGLSMALDRFPGKPLYREAKAAKAVRKKRLTLRKRPAVRLRGTLMNRPGLLGKSLPNPGLNLRQTRCQVDHSLRIQSRRL